MMKLLPLALILAVQSCHPVPIPVPVPPAPPADLTMQFTVWDAQQGVPLYSAYATATPDNAQPIDCSTDTTHARIACHVGLARRGNLDVYAPGFRPFNMSIDFVANFPDVGLFPVPPPHVDPSVYKLTELARIRGAMWSVRLDIPFGPRPGRPDNIAATDFITDYTPADQLRIIEAIKQRGYTHVVMGPLVDSDGYHGQYPSNDWRGANFDRFLDAAQLFWDNGLAPVVFIHPDGWSFEQTRDELTPLLQQPRAQRLLRIIVPAGWEPTRYDWSSCTWALFEQWGRQTLPNALVLLHTVSEVDAPVGTDARCDDNGHPNAEGWQRVVPYLHGWLIQNGPYGFAPKDDPITAQNFGNQFRNVNGSLWQRFHLGYAGWPTNSAWTDGSYLRLYSGEATAYGSYWSNLPEAVSQAWGDLAIASGASGYLDGGTVPIP